MNFHGVKEKVRYWIEWLFHDEVIAVEPPVEHYETYRDVGTRLEGFDVAVTYKLRGKQTILFPIDNDHFLIISPKCARRNAEQYYEKTKQNIEKAKKKHEQKAR